MANPKTTAPVVPEEERVDLFVPRGSANDDPNLFIGINGVNYLLPRGKTSRVPKFVAAEYYRSQEAEAKQAEHIQEMVVKPEK
jgi:hypothetical protein